MSEQPLTLAEFLVAIRPHLERQVDAMISEADLEDRPFLTARRAQIMSEVTHATEAMNLRYRLREAEARLRPRLVE